MRSWNQLVLLGLVVASVAPAATPAKFTVNPLLGDWSFEQLVGPCYAAHLAFKPDRVVFSFQGKADTVTPVSYRVVSPSSVEVTARGAKPQLITIRQDGIIPYKDCTFHRTP